MSTETITPPTVDPLFLLKGIASLRRLTGMYPAGHPAIIQKLEEIDEPIQRHLQESPELRLDIIHGQAHLDGIPFRGEGESHAQVVRELGELGVDSIHIRAGITREEILALSEFLWQMKDIRPGEGPGSIDVLLAKRQIHHVTLGRLVPLDTRWRAAQWPDAPTGPIDPDYEQSVAMTEQTFEHAAAGEGVNVGLVRDIVELLMRKVAASSAALGQILAVKQYENLTYYHSVNVATLSLLIARQAGFDESATAMVVEAALLHDIGKTRIPLEVLRKPGALDKRERKMMESHTVFGAQILVEIGGLHALTPTAALEHHRGFDGTGYPDLGQGIVPHLLSQLVSVADIYEAMTGARSYQEPKMPEQACLVLARLAGTKLNTALVKAFINAVTFFPVGSMVRTDRDEIGIVSATVPGEPLHPVVTLMAPDRLPQPGGPIDTSARDSSGGYERHVVETVMPPEGFSVVEFLSRVGGN
jgi:putative nucleotidyltransferase with HDIG domain